MTLKKSLALAVGADPKASNLTYSDLLGMAAASHPNGDRDFVLNFGSDMVFELDALESRIRSKEDAELVVNTSSAVNVTLPKLRPGDVVWVGVKDEKELGLIIPPSCQQPLMTNDPVTGDAEPYPSHAGQYRKFHGRVAWLFNPWTGAARDARDIGSDVTGLLIKESSND